MRSTRTLLQVTKEYVKDTVTATATAKKVLKEKPWSPINYRSWRDLDPSFDKTIPAERKFTILSYNLLNKSYVWPKLYDEYVPKEYQDWNYRLGLLKKTLTDKTIQSDIMCLQEVDRETYDTVWKPTFESQGYGCEYKKKERPEVQNVELKEESIPGIENSNEEQNTISRKNVDDGIAVLYNKSKFELKEKHEFNFYEHYVKMKGKTTTKQPLLNIPLRYELVENDLLERNQVAQIIVLQHIETGKLIILGNTHLYWKTQSMQFVQALIFVDALNDVHKKLPTSTTVVLAGDLNSTPMSSVYDYLREKEVKILKNNAFGRYMVTDSHAHKKFKSRSPIKFGMSLYTKLLDIQVFKKQTKKVKELDTCITKNFQGPLDYVWFNVRHLKLIRVLTGLKEEYVNSIEGLPNADHPSDHIPVRGEFAIVQRRKQTNDHTYN